MSRNQTEINNGSHQLEITLLHTNLTHDPSCHPRTAVARLLNLLFVSGEVE
jgi:hypothetical protein